MSAEKAKEDNFKAKGNDECSFSRGMEPFSDQFESETKNADIKPFME